MKKPPAGKKFFWILGYNWRNNRHRRLAAFDFGNLPLWARNAFTDGFFGVRGINKK